VSSTSQSPPAPREAVVAAVIESGPYLGFDTNAFPGGEAMRAWRLEGEFLWVGYYLPSPCYNDTLWSGKRELLEQT